MDRLTYTIVQHDGGWAYRVNETFSEPFLTHNDARLAAERAASAQQAPGDASKIVYEDAQGRWHEENTAPNDRPKANVRG